MAAYAALVSLMNDLELIPNHPIHSFSFDNKQITSLSQIVQFLIHFMETYDSHGCTTEALESRIASAAHAAHDVIESHIVDQIQAGSTLDGKATSYFLLDLQKAIDNMYFVKRKAMQFQTKSGLQAEQPTYSAPTSSQPLTSEKNLMVGFDDVVVRLMGMLIGEPSSQRVIPIVGMGGMGKTTLARNVYDHLLTVQHFDIRLWATISQEYSVVNIFTQLLFGERRTTSGGNVNRLGEELHKTLWSRRYLIVLDDMWSVGAWNEIQMFFPDNGNGSCVIVTSRLSNLAAHLNSSPFEMNFLDDDKNWELFCGKAFGEEDCPDELEEIGKKIVKRCRGLPLAIVVIGGHLRRSSRAIEYWEKVANSMNPISSIGADDQCLKIVSLSYEQLLKPCFLVMGIFREDARINSSQLVKYWVAEGFLKAKEGLSLEEVAEDLLKDLIDRNLILVRERRWNGKAKYCGIHDIVRELCLKVGKKEKFVYVLEDTTQAIQRERRIVISKRMCEYHSYEIACALRLAPLLRSVTSHVDQLGVGRLSSNFRLLRVSAFVKEYDVKDDESLTATDFQEVNLRYLAFYNQRNSLDRPYLPSSISMFWNLQTLIIRNYGVQITAPYQIWEMPQVRHLEFLQICLPDPQSNHQECIVLRNLHTLKGVANLRLTEEVCKRMPNIKRLSILYDHFPGECKASSYYCPHNLGRFNKLESLKCKFGDNSKWRDVILCFTFPRSLEKLSLWNSHLHWDDLTMMNKSLPHLGYLKLDSVQGPEWDLVEEEFLSLKILRISRCNDLIYWNANSSNFRSSRSFIVGEHPN